MFADYYALSAGSYANLQHTVNLFSSACDNFDLIISTKKTEVMYHSAQGKRYRESVITVK